jgi:hypothetical protein
MNLSAAVSVAPIGVYPRAAIISPLFKEKEAVKSGKPNLLTVNTLDPFEGVE